MKKDDDSPFIQEFVDTMSKLRNKPIKYKVCVQGINPYEEACKNDKFENPFNQEETLERIKSGGFDNLYELFDIVSKLKSCDVEKFKKWWLEDGTKTGALNIINIRKEIL